MPSCSDVPRSQHLLRVKRVCPQHGALGGTQGAPCSTGQCPRPRRPAPGRLWVLLGAPPPHPLTIYLYF